MRTIALASVLVLLAAAAARAEDAAAEAALAALQARYDAARSLRLAFEQRYTNRATGRTLSERGTLLAVKPGRMRWEYGDSGKLFVLREDQAWFFVPDEGVVYKMKAGADQARRVPSLFLAGRGNLSRDFAATSEPAASSTGGDGLTLKLVPRTGGEEYDHLLLGLDAQGTALRSLTVIDPLGNRTEYLFHDEERDVAVPEGAFDFRPPRGAEVVEADAG